MFKCKLQMCGSTVGFATYLRDQKIFTLKINMNSKYKILIYFLFAIIVLLFLGGATIDLNTLLITGSVAALGILAVLPIKEDAEE